MKYSLVKLDDDPRRDDDASRRDLNNEGSMVQTYQNINVHVVNLYDKSYTNVG